MKDFKDFKKELLKNKETKEAYNDLSLEFEIISLLIEKRIKNKITQKDLAKKIGTKQSSISRFESGDYNPSISFINKIAKALDAKIEINIK
ncbi:MAG: helix-turn-helix transcriptional regulator [Candidatus Paceibacterota bacterium]